MDGSITWARLWPAAKVSVRRLRQGAWYPVTGTHVDGRLVLLVGRKRIALAKRHFETKTDPPLRFTIVWRRPPNPHATRTSPEMGCAYAVCPSCTVRLPLERRQTHFRCEACGHPGKADRDMIF